MICKIILLGLAGLTLAGEPDVFQNYFDDTIKEVDIPLDAAIKACLQNGNTFADKVKKAYADCFGSADYDFGDLAAKEGSKDSDNDGLPDSFENNEQCFYKKMGWVNEAGALNPDAIKGDLAGMESGTKAEFDGNIDKCASWNGDFGSRRKREVGENETEEEASNVPSVMESGKSALGWLKAAVRKTRSADPGNANKKRSKKNKNKNSPGRKGKGNRNAKKGKGKGKGKNNAKKGKGKRRRNKGRNAKKKRSKKNKNKNRPRRKGKGNRNAKKGKGNNNAKKGKGKRRRNKGRNANKKRSKKNKNKNGPGRKGKGNRSAKKGKGNGNGKKGKGNGNGKKGGKNRKKPKRNNRNGPNSKKSNSKKPKGPKKDNRNSNAMDESTYNKLWCFDLSLEQILEKCVENKIKN